MSENEPINPTTMPIPEASYPAMIETLASLLRHMELIEAGQRQQAKSIDRTVRHFGEVSARLDALHGTLLRLDAWTEMLIRDVDGARNIVIQAEHQMQQSVASINERLLSLTADVHKLHLIRETPEYKINALRSELAAIQQHLAPTENPSSAPSE